MVMQAQLFKSNGLIRLWMRWMVAHRRFLRDLSALRFQSKKAFGIAAKGHGAAMRNHNEDAPEQKKLLTEGNEANEGGNEAAQQKCATNSSTRSFRFRCLRFLL